ncbi:MAG: hypothetical protein EOM26_13705 [Alphaproteobacteria bacterium]|nr:hypothetical protein [Alphaproteobacteria bacterium]
MEREAKGTVMIRTIFGEVSEDYFPALSREEMIENEEWRVAVGAEGGPFRHTDDERLMPF